MMKKKFQLLGLAGIFILSFVVPLFGFQVKIDRDTFVNIATKTRTFYLNEDKDKTHNYRSNRIQVSKVRITGKGQINKFVQFYEIFDTYYDRKTNENPSSLEEAGVQFSFCPEFVVKFGKIRVPFSRHNFTARHLSPVMSGNGDSFLPDQFKTILKAIKPYPGRYKASDPFKKTDLGIVIAGYIDNGLFKYYLGFFNEDRSISNKVWTLARGWANATTVESVKDKKGFEYDIRIEFTPTFLGFKSEKTPLYVAMREAQTYLGKFDTFTIGVGYHHEKHLNGLNTATYGMSSLTRHGWDADFSLEKTFAQKYITGLEAGYMNFHNTHLYETAPNIYKKGDSWTWYLGGHLIYGKKMGMGYPGIAFRYEYIEIDGKYHNENNLAYDRYGICFDYWFSRGTRIAVGIDFVNAKDALKKYLKANHYKYATATWYMGVFTKF